MDIVGDWSPVQTQGLLRSFLHWSEHAKMDVDPVKASHRNEITNLSLLERVSAQLERPARTRSVAVAVTAATA